MAGEWGGGGLYMFREPETLPNGYRADCTRTVNSNATLKNQDLTG